MSITVPGQVSMNHEAHDGPMAFPVSMVMQRPGEVRFVSLGGISKRLMLAAMLYSPIGDEPESRAFAAADRLIDFERQQAEAAKKLNGLVT